jgi:hypothetical protein
MFLGKGEKSLHLRLARRVPLMYDNLNFPVGVGKLRHAESWLS